MNDDQLLAWLLYSIADAKGCLYCIYSIEDSFGNVGCTVWDDNLIEANSKKFKGKYCMSGMKQKALEVGIHDRNIQKYQEER